MALGLGDLVVLAAVRWVDKAELSCVLSLCLSGAVCRSRREEKGPRDSPLWASL